MVIGACILNHHFMWRFEVSLDVSLEVGLEVVYTGREISLNVILLISCIPFGHFLPGSPMCHSDWLEGAAGPRQSGASTRAPRRGELGGGRRPPPCEYVHIRGFPRYTMVATNTSAPLASLSSAVEAQNLRHEVRPGMLVNSVYNNMSVWGGSWGSGCCRGARFRLRRRRRRS